MKLTSCGHLQSWKYISEVHCSFCNGFVLEGHVDMYHRGIHWLIKKVFLVRRGNTLKPELFISTSPSLSSFCMMKCDEFTSGFKCLKHLAKLSCTQGFFICLRCCRVSSSFSGCLDDFQDIKHFLLLTLPKQIFPFPYSELCFNLNS